MPDETPLVDAHADQPTNQEPDGATDQPTDGSTDQAPNGSGDQVDDAQISLGAVEIDDRLAVNDAGSLSETDAIAQFETDWTAQEGVG